MSAWRNQRNFKYAYRDSVGRAPTVNGAPKALRVSSLAALTLSILCLAATNAPDFAGLNPRNSYFVTNAESKRVLRVVEGVSVSLVSSNHHYATPYVPVTNIWITFSPQRFGNNMQPSNTLYEIAWTTNFRTAAKFVTNELYAKFSLMPQGWSHYCWTPTTTNAFPNTNREAYFIIRAFDTSAWRYSPWATK